MGELQRAFGQLLAGVGAVSRATIRFPKVEDITSAKYAGMIGDAYMQLGGTLASPPLNLRAWDVEFEGIAVELDEHLHFNRYRGLTLSSEAYSLLRGFPLIEYRAYCSEFEGKCLAAGRYGGKWSNPSCEKQFGSGSAPGMLQGSGAPRWKQRAYYDFVKDLSPLLIQVQVVRVAIWDRVEDGASVSRFVHEVISRPTKTSAQTLANLVRARAR